MLETVDEYLPRALVDGQLGILVSGIWCPTHPVFNLLQKTHVPTNTSPQIPGRTNKESVLSSKEYVKGDVCEPFRANMEMIDGNMDVEYIQSKSKQEFNTEIKQKIREAALKNLNNKQK